MKIVCLFICFLCTLIGYGQKANPDTLIPYKKAAILSACLPGAGQIYNSIKTTGRKNAYWKVPLIAAGLGGTSYFLIQNQQLVSNIKTEYKQRLNGGVTDPRWADYDTPALISLYEQYARLRDLSILGIGAVYALQIMDAAVEAHFLKFDVSKDLSLTLYPKQLNSSGILIGARLNFTSKP